VEDGEKKKKRERQGPTFHILTSTSQLCTYHNCECAKRSHHLCSLCATSTLFFHFLHLHLTSNSNLPPFHHRHYFHLHLHLHLTSTSPLPHHHFSPPPHLHFSPPPHSSTQPLIWASHRRAVTTLLCYFEWR